METGIIVSEAGGQTRAEVMHLLRVLADPRTWRRKEERIRLPDEVALYGEDLPVPETYVIWEADVRFNTVSGKAPPWEAITEILERFRDGGTG